MSSYPKALSYYLSRLENFSRQNYRLQTISATTFNPLDLCVIELPQGLVDLTTFTLKANLSTSYVGGDSNVSVYAPPVELLIDNIMIECSGVSLQSGFSGYGDLFNIYRDFQLWNKMPLRGVLQNDANPVSVTPGHAITTKPIAIYNWLGWLGSIKVWDSTLVGPTKIYIRWASPGVLSSGNTGDAPTSVSYQLTNTTASVDVLDISDGVYYNMVANRLASSPIEVPYDNVTTVVGTQSAVSSSTRWSTSADCLTGVIGTVKNVNYNTNAHNGVTQLSEWFTRGASYSPITSSVWYVNGVPYPSIPTQTQIGETFIDTVHTLQESHDLYTSPNPNLSSLSNANNYFFAHAHSWTYPDNDDGHRLTGISGRGNQVIGNWQLTGAGSNVQPVIFLQHRSVVRIGSNKLIEMVL
jgi:hypothetical protein